MKNTNTRSILISRIISLSFCIAVILILRNTILNRKMTEHSFSGYTMGTTFSIKIANKPIRVKKWEAYKSQISNLLISVNNIFSNYIPDSELTKLNNNKVVNNEIEISTELFKVLFKANEVYKNTKGAFDVTVGNVVDLWGFGDKKKNDFPTDDEIKKTMEYCGMDKLVLKPPNFIIKKHPDLKIILGAIAKGYGVDVVSNFLISEGFSDFIVEIGGEVFANGNSNKNSLWKIGIDSPESNLIPGSKIFSAITLKNKAIATSGSYRQFFEKNNEKYTHIVNPATGYPVKTNTVSVSVIAPTCMEADAYATALFVMNVNDGLELIKKINNIEAYFITKESDGTFKVNKTDGFITE